MLPGEIYRLHYITARHSLRKDIYQLDPSVNCF